MAKLTKETVESFERYSDYRRKRLTPEEIEQQDLEANWELAVLKSMQESISSEVACFMAREKIGFNELTRRLGTSSRQSSRIIKGEANITIATLVELAAVMGKRPRIVFDDEVHEKHRGSPGKKKKAGRRPI